MCSKLLQPRMNYKNIVKENWCPSQIGWVKCNMAIAWSKHSRLGGCAWVLRNHLGEVLLHSWRYFQHIKSKDELTFKCCCLTIESMHSHNLNKVVFASEFVEFVGGISRPKAWPSFAYQISKVIKRLETIHDWWFVCESPETNRGASLIAQSATNPTLANSYVALGHPFWLQNLFVGERDLSP